MHAKALRILEKIDELARDAAARRQNRRLQALLAKALLVHELDREFRLRSPRYYHVKDHFPLTSYWTHAQGLPDRLADAAYMKFIGFPRFLFDNMAERLRPLLPGYDLKSVTGPGRRHTLDHKDLLAIGLRAFRVRKQDNLSIDFCLPQPRISEALAVIKPVLAEAVRAWPDAAVRMLTKDEATEIWKSLMEQHGISDELRVAFEGLTIAYSIDGCVTNGFH